MRRQGQETGLGQAMKIQGKLGKGENKNQVTSKQVKLEQQTQVNRPSNIKNAGQTDSIL